MSEPTDRAESLAIVLAYAYRGIAAQGASCHVDRDADCPLCESLADVEAGLEVRDELPQREWWRPTWLERWWRIRRNARTRRRSSGTI